MREQARVGEFTRHIGATPQSQLANFKGEVIEALIEHSNNGFTPEFGMEINDVIISCLGLLNVIGLDFERLFDEKMRIAWNKYRLVPLYVAQGDSPDLARARAKSLWEETPQIKPELTVEQRLERDRLELEDIKENAKWNTDGSRY